MVYSSPQVTESTTPPPPQLKYIEINKATVADLKSFLRFKKEVISGNKATLKSRVQGMIGNDLSFTLDIQPIITSTTIITTTTTTNVSAPICWVVKEGTHQYITEDVTPLGGYAPTTVESQPVQERRFYLLGNKRINHPMLQRGGRGRKGYMMQCLIHKG